MRHGILVQDPVGLRSLSPQYREWRTTQRRIEFTTPTPTQTPWSTLPISPDSVSAFTRELHHDAGRTSISDHAADHTANAERLYEQGYNDEEEDILSQADKAITEYEQLLTDQIKKYYTVYCEGTDATCMVLPQDNPEGIPRRRRLFQARTTRRQL
jgi:hypothetical protein